MEAEAAAEAIQVWLLRAFLVSYFATKRSFPSVEKLPVTMCNVALGMYVYQCDLLSTSQQLKGEAEAFAIEEKARAEAEQMAKKADAWKDYQDAAMVDMVLETMPKVGVLDSQKKNLLRGSLYFFLVTGFVALGYYFKLQSRLYT